jgi:phospholipase C
VRHPGKLNVSAWARYSVRIRVDGRWQVSKTTLPVTVEIKTPDGQPFTADHVTMNDIWRFRDLRGVSQGDWSYRAHGQASEEVDAGETLVTADDGRVTISLEETVTSQGAPLVSDNLPANLAYQYPIDLFHVGMFTATAQTQLPLLGRGRPIKLIDPDGNVVAVSNEGSISYPVTLQTIDQSRDANGGYRAWQLDVAAVRGLDGPTPIRAQVMASARVSKQVLQSRINTMLGPNGHFVSIYGEIEGTDLVARLVIHDKVSAETIDMHRLLDSVIEWPDPNDPKDVAPEVVYTIARHTRDLDYEMHVSLDDLRITAIDISIGQSEQIQPAVPALKVQVGVSGGATIKLGGFPIATANIRDNSISLEAGIRLNADGSFTPVHWVQDDRLDVDVSWEAAVAAGVVSLGVLSLGAAGAAEYIEHEFNEAIARRFGAVLDSALGRAPRIFELLMGGELNYTGLRLDGDDLVFDYYAPPEQNRRPNPNYVGIQGRSATQLGPNDWEIRPRTMGDTWATGNLSKVDHIVVVMMENRSFDHVLGYRARLPNAENADGLTDELLDFLKSKKLSLSDIPRNYFNLTTKFPISVGHHLADVTQQLCTRATLPSGRAINGPDGFVSNFIKQHTSLSPMGPDDVLGYYDQDDLAFFKFLAENYAYCEKYFCSHAGPTLPNRMFSLAGEVQYDRTGEAILDNNNGDNFILSRAQTIFDLLTRKGVSWRVYESSPSVTMLRMFARYAGDNTHIVPVGRSHVERLADDVARAQPGDFPSVIMVDPAMHHFPENDDHPVADMYNGQIFLKDIYDALRSNPDIWRKTMIIITYDEHGGFYDHVIPPDAEARTRPMVVGTESPPGSSPGPGPWTPSTLITPYGVRVPTFVVSPWTPPGKGPDIVLDHCSILKTIIARFCPDRPFLSDRVRASRSFDAYLSAQEARLDVPPAPYMQPIPLDAQLDAHLPAMPGAGQIMTEPMTRKKMREGNIDAHSLLGMLARMLGR